MEKCGHYTADRTVAWGRKATYYSAFGGAEAGEQRVVIRCARTNARADVQSFLRASAEQETAVVRGCRRVAPILDFGISELGRAYQVSLAYETSLGDWIEAKNVVEPDALKTIVGGTLRALTDLRDKCRRAHGNLTAGNILLDASGEVILTDLAPFAREASHAEDLRALGTIIYQAIRKSLHVGFLTPPLEHSPEWAEALEEHADDWRELTNRLLSARKDRDAEALTQATKDLKSLDSLAEKAVPMPSAAAAHRAGGAPAGLEQRSSVKRKGKKGLVAAVVVAVCGAGGFAVWKSMQPKPVIVEAAPKPRMASDDFKKAIPATAAASLGEGKYILDYLNASASPTEMANHLRGWVTTERLAKIEQDWRARPAAVWKKLADLLTTDATLDGGWDELDEAEQDERLTKALKDLGRAGTLLSGSQNLDARWARTKQAADRVQALAISGLPNFTGWAETDLGNSENIEGAIQRALAAEKALNELADAGAKLKNRIRPEALRAAAAEPTRTDAKDPLLPKWWQAKLEASVAPLEEVTDGWKEAFGRIQNRIAKRQGEEQKGLQKQLAALRERSETILESEQASLTEQLAKLESSIRDPLEDLDAEFRRDFVAFAAAMERATTTDAAVAEADRYHTALNRLVRMPEYTEAVPALKRRYKIQDFGEFFARLTNASRKPKKSIYNFPNATGRWTEVPNSAKEKSATFIFSGRRGGQSEPITFHNLDQTTAMASAETSLALAKLADLLPLEVPRDGVLSFRDSRAGLDRWLWPTIESWTKSVVSKNAGDPEKMLPRERNVESCPYTWVSGNRAAQVAAALGGRLPKRAEWEAALGLFPPASARLQSTVFVDLDKKNVNLQLRNSIAKPPLALGAFPFPRDGGGFEFRGTVADQGILWLAPARNSAERIVDLVGNAAEWLSDAAGSFQIIGGSCVSPATGPILKPFPASGGTGFFDVTFHLVVSITPGSENAGLEAMQAEVKKEVAQRKGGGSPSP